MNEPTDQEREHHDEWHGTSDDGGVYCDYDPFCPLIPEDRRGLDHGGR